MNDQESMQNRVKGWLEGGGYPLEMRSAALFRTAGFKVRQAQHYVDAQSDKSREIDLICVVNESIGMASLELVVECKSTDKPWVVFSSQFTLDGYNRLFAIGILSDLASAYLADMATEASTSLTWFKKQGRIGYAATQAFAGSQDLAYSAAMSAVNACLARHRERTHPFLATFPVIVVDAPIFECYLDDDEVQLTEVTETEFFFGAHVGDFSGTCVRIVSLQALPNFSRLAKAELDALLRMLTPAIEREWQALGMNISKFTRRRQRRIKR